MTDDPSWLTEVRADLEAALDAEEPSEKNYHIRAALQQVTVQQGDDE